MESKSSLSHSNFNTTIVELNDVAIPIYREVMTSNQKRRETRNHAMVLQTTWRIQTKTVLAHNPLIVAGESSIQMIKSRKTIPTSEKVFKNSYLAKKLGNMKAITVPAKI